MFRIGEFSRIAQVTIETLRHYDAVELLKPAKVDPFTGYRYYSAQQLQPLNRIRALKELGFSLDEIARILQENLTDEQLRGMLKMQQVTAVRDLQAAQTRLDRVTARLKYLNSEDEMSAFDVTLKSVKAQTIAGIREVVPTAEEVPDRCNALFDTIAQWMVVNQLSFGPAMTIYYNESYTKEHVDLECAFIIPKPNKANTAVSQDPIVVRELTAVPEMAITIVTDNFFNEIDGLTPAYNALGQWIDANGYKIAGPPRELFHGSPDKGDLTAEIQFPITKT